MRLSDVGRCDGWWFFRIGKMRRARYDPRQGGGSVFTLELPLA